MKRTQNCYHDFLPLKKQNEQKFFCPFCTGNGEQVILNKIVVFEEEIVNEEIETFERVKKRGKWLLKKVRVKSKGSLLTKRHNRLQCPKCKLIYTQSQFFKSQNADLRKK